MNLVPPELSQATTKQGIMVAEQPLPSKRVTASVDDAQRAGLLKAFEDAPLNTRVYTDGQTATSKQSFVSECIAVSTLLLYTGWLHIMLGLILTAWMPIPRAVLLGLLSTLLLPARPVLWPAFNQLSVFCTWREYFKFSYLYEGRLDPHKKYIFAETPHGCFPLGPLVAGTACSSMFPGFHIYSLAASSVFSVPLWRHFIAWIGSMSATPANFKQLLRRGSVAVIVGGIAEMYMLHPRKEVVVLRDRKGFVKVAVEEGVPIVCVYHFGNSQLLSFYPQSLAKTARRLRAAIGLFFGRYGLPLPRKVPVFMVCSKPIDVGPQMARSDPKFLAHVDEVHARVITELQEMYDRHKAEYGWADRPLEIV